MVLSASIFSSFDHLERDFVKGLFLSYPEDKLHARNSLGFTTRGFDKVEDYSRVLRG